MQTFDHRIKNYFNRSNIRCQIAYKGTRYLGWQKTKMGPSVEETLEKAFRQILREEISLQAASRTDRGVHAKGQIINFFTQKDSLDLPKLHRSMQGLLPHDISIDKIELAPLDFHPTLDCIAKEYRYLICNREIELPFYHDLSWHYRYPLNLSLMQKAAHILTGTHDFSALSNERTKSPPKAMRKVLSITICPLEEGRISIHVKGVSFLYKMVRNLVGTLVYIGSGRISLDDLPEILKSRDRKQAGVTAPAHGLYLHKVFYTADS